MNTKLKGQLIWPQRETKRIRPYWILQSENKRIQRRRINYLKVYPRIMQEIIKFVLTSINEIVAFMIIKHFSKNIMLKSEYFDTVV